MSHHAMRHSDIDWKLYGYDHIKICGGGTYGRAYLLRSTKEDKALRIAKVVDMSELTQTCRLNALQEANLLLSFRHPHIVPCYEAFIHQDCYLVMIMEYCQGGDMACCISNMRATKTTFTEAEISKMLSQLLAALMFIHGNQILHRDLKPSNILIDKNGDLKIADFGVSKLLSSGTSCSANTSVGTANYMPPEMCKRRPYTFHSDMWSLGCVIYEMITLRSAFDGESLIALAWNVCFENPPAVQGDYSGALKRLVLNLLEKEPEARELPSRLLHHPVITTAAESNAARSVILERSPPGSPGGYNNPPTSPSWGPARLGAVSEERSQSDESEQRPGSPALDIIDPLSSQVRTLSYCGTGANETLYCQLIIHRIRLGMISKRTHLAVMLLRVSDEWTPLVQSVPASRPDFSDREEPEAGVLKAIYNEIFDNYLPGSQPGSHSTSGDPISQQESALDPQEHLVRVERALNKRIDSGGLLMASAKFGLHISEDEAELLIAKMRQNSPTIMDFESVLSTPLTEFRDSFLSAEAPNGSISGTDERLPTAEEVYAWAASLLLNEETAAGLEAAMHDFASISGGGETRIKRGQFARVMCVRFNVLKGEEHNRLYQVCSKSHEGDVLWHSTLRALTASTAGAETSWQGPKQSEINLSSIVPGDVTTVESGAGPTPAVTDCTSALLHSVSESSTHRLSEKSESSPTWSSGRNSNVSQEYLSPLQAINLEDRTRAASGFLSDEDLALQGTLSASRSAGAHKAALGNQNYGISTSDKAKRRQGGLSSAPLREQSQAVVTARSDGDPLHSWRGPAPQGAGRFARRKESAGLLRDQTGSTQGPPFASDELAPHPSARSPPSDTRSTLASSEESNAPQGDKLQRPCIRPQASQRAGRQWIRLQSSDLSTMRLWDQRQPANVVVRLVFEMPAGMHFFSEEEEDGDYYDDGRYQDDDAVSVELPSDESEQLSQNRDQDTLATRPSPHNWETSRVATEESARDLANLLLYTIANLERTIEELLISTRDSHSAYPSSRLTPVDAQWQRLRQALTEVDHTICAVVPPKIYHHQERLCDSRGGHEWLSEAFERLSNYIGQVTTHVHSLAASLLRGSFESNSCGAGLSKNKLYDYSGTFSRLSRELVVLLGHFVPTIHAKNNVDMMVSREKAMGRLRDSSHYPQSDALESVIDMTKATRRWAERYASTSLEEPPVPATSSSIRKTESALCGWFPAERAEVLQQEAVSARRTQRHRAGSTWALPHTESRLYETPPCRPTRNVATVSNLRSVDERYQPRSTRRSSVLVESRKHRVFQPTSQSSNDSKDSLSSYPKSAEYYPRKYTGSMGDSEKRAAAMQQRQQDVKRTQSTRRNI